MSDETKVPPGWVRLTLRGGGEAVVPIKGLAVCDHEDGSGMALVSGPSCYHEVRETVSEVAALIAAAEAAERRARALPVMAAIIGASIEDGPEWDDVCVDAAALTLDAIERREVTDD